MIEWNYSAKHAPFDAPLLVAVKWFGELEYWVCVRDSNVNMPGQAAWGDGDGRRFDDESICAWAHIDPPKTGDVV